MAMNESKTTHKLAWRELQNLCFMLESDVDVIDSMSLEEAMDELRGLGLDPELVPNEVIPQKTQRETRTFERRQSSGSAGYRVLESGAMTEGGLALVIVAPETLSFDEAFALHHRAVFRTARAVVRDAALAEDITQEVFLRLYRNMNATPGEESLRAWLLRVTLNVARNQLRETTRSMVRDNEYRKESLESGIYVDAPEEDYERRVAIEEARRALDRIKEPMRSCLLLRQQGLSYQEIATALSLKEQNIGSLVKRGRAEFARVYGKIGGRR
jgi:RNA polymerase sigma factor (sigma-70 family)